MQNALDLTLQNRNEMYVLYDDFGKLCLKSLEQMKLGLIIDEETGENFDYTSSIDSDTYNKIKLTYDNEKTGKREVYIAKDSSHINEWGVLQHFDTIDENTNGQAKADALLKLYNQKTRKLQIKSAIGDTRVRGGSLIIINMNLGDVKLQNFMLVEKVKHTFKNNEHFMDLDLRRRRIYLIMADMVEAVKKIVQGVQSESSPCNVLYGRVTSINPLEIEVEQKFKLTKEFLILTNNVRDHNMTITLEGVTKNVKVHNALKIRDKVLLIRQLGGQKYVILDKVV